MLQRTDGVVGVAWVGRYKKNMGYIPSAIVLMLLAFSWVKHMLLRIVVRMRRVKQE